MGLPVNVPFWGFVSHHLEIDVGDDIPKSRVMFNWDICDPLFMGTGTITGTIPKMWLMIGFTMVYRIAVIQLQ